MGDRKIRIGAVLDLLHLPPLRAMAVQEIARSGEDHAVEVLAEAIDRIVPWDKVIPGPIGTVVELADRPLYCRPIAKKIVHDVMK